MNLSFKDAFCLKEGVAPEDFTRAVFERTLMRRKLFLAGWTRRLRPHFFEHDERLIDVCGAKHRMAEVKKEISEYFADRDVWGFWRGTMEIRISTERLRITAAQYLPKE